MPTPPPVPETCPHCGQQLVPATTEPAAKTKRATSFPAEFFVTSAMRAWAAEKTPTVDLRAETEQFCDYHRAKGDRMKDWTAAWRTWMRNAVKFSRTRPAGRAVTTPNGHRVSQSFANVEHYFATKRQAQERTIERTSD